MGADAHLDADDDVAIGIGDSNGVDGIHHPHLFALAHHHPLAEAVDAGVGDVEIGQDPHLARLDHMLAEAGEIARPGAARITAVVTPESLQNSSASMPSEVPPQ